MKINKEYNDLSQRKIIEKMKKFIDQGWLCFIKWTCDKCGERVTCNTPNAFFTEGYTHEECGHTSYPKKFGLMIILDKYNMELLEKQNENK